LDTILCALTAEDNQDCGSLVEACSRDKLPRLAMPL